MPWCKEYTYPGEQLFRLTAVERVGRDKKGGMLKWRYVCICGKSTVAIAAHVRSGHTKSCGCLNKERVAETCRTRSFKHGGAGRQNKMPEYLVWGAMISRCTNPNQISYKNYGARGINVCPEWASSFATFIADMGRRPSDKHSIDRFPDNNGNYEPGNCRWATAQQQNQNKRKAISPSRLREYIAAAKRALEAGEPKFALVILKWSENATPKAPAPSAADEQGAAVPCSPLFAAQLQPPMTLKAGAA